VRIHEVQLRPESPLSERVSFSIPKLITFFLGTSLFIILLLFSIRQEYLRIKQFRRHYVHVQICLNRVPMLLVKTTGRSNTERTLLNFAYLNMSTEIVNSNKQLVRPFPNFYGRFLPRYHDLLDYCVLE
jgi:hypothetical protein